MRKTILIIALLGAALAVFTIGCGGGEVEVDPSVVLGEKMEPVHAAATTLEGARAELTAMQARITEAEAMSEADMNDERILQFGADQAALDGAQADVDELFGALQSVMADALDLALNEYPQAPETAELLDLYSRETLISSVSYITEDARYDKAINALRTAKDYWTYCDLPAPETLTQRIAEYTDAQFLTREAFDLLVKGLSKDEVLEITGPVSEGNKRNGDNGVTYFVFKTKEGPIPAIYFNDKDIVYTTQWDAFAKKDTDDEG